MDSALTGKRDAPRRRSRLASFVLDDHRYVLLGTSVVAFIGMMLSSQSRPALSFLANAFHELARIELGDNFVPQLAVHNVALREQHIAFAVVDLDDLHFDFVAQFDMAMLQAADHGVGYYVPFSLFPATSRDVAFVAPAGLTHADVLEFIRRAKPADLESVRLFDIFEKDGRKSMAYQLTFRNRERTLTDAEVNSRFEKLREKMRNELKVELR